MIYFVKRSYGIQSKGENRMYQNLFDSHTHSDNSHDGHAPISLMCEAAQVAKTAEAGELWLTHFSPATYHPEVFEEQVRDVFPQTFIGQDGMKKTLRFVD